MNTDRFIWSPTPKTRQLISSNCDKEIVPNQYTDSKLAKIYRKIVVDQSQVHNENFKQFYSQKTINIEDDACANVERLGKLGLGASQLEIQIDPVIIKKPDRILEAASLPDDFYVNLLDCSVDSVLAVGLSRGVYLWTPSGKIQRIRNAEGLTCIKWNPKNPGLIACGTSKGALQIWDAQQNKRLTSFNFHTSRVGCAQWFGDADCLLSGGKNCQIFTYDLRTNKKIGRYQYGHREICSLKTQPCNWSSSLQNFAAGQTDGSLVLWNPRMKRPELTFQHKGAVKGLAWHPSRRGILTSGGGNSDYCIKMWNTKSNELVKKVNTGSQVCNLMYINDGENLVSTHGFNQFETNIWQTQNMEKKYTLIGHTKRVLFLAAEPEGDTIITGAGDQTVRFWKLKSKKKPKSLVVQDHHMTIR